MGARSGPTDPADGADHGHGRPHFYDAAGGWITLRTRPISANVPGIKDAGRVSLRLGKSESCLIEIDGDLTGARAARMFVSAHASHELPGELSLNNKVLATIPPSRPHFGVEVDTQFDVPIDLLKTGENTFTAASETEAHPLAIMWPGPVLMVEFPSK